MDRPLTTEPTLFKMRSAVTKRARAALLSCLPVRVLFFAIDALEVLFPRASHQSAPYSVLLDDPFPLRDKRVLMTGYTFDENVAFVLAELGATVEIATDNFEKAVTVFHRFVTRNIVTVDPPTPPSFLDTD